MNDHSLIISRKLKYILSCNCPSMTQTPSTRPGVSVCRGTALVWVSYLFNSIDIPNERAHVWKQWIIRNRLRMLPLRHTNNTHNYIQVSFRHANVLSEPGVFLYKLTQKNVRSTLVLGVSQYCKILFYLKKNDNWNSVHISNADRNIASISEPFKAFIQTVYLNKPC